MKYYIYNPFNGMRFPTIELTLQFYAIRIHLGKSAAFLVQAKQLAQNESWDKKIQKAIKAAQNEIRLAKNAFIRFNELFAGLLEIESMEKLYSETPEKYNDITYHIKRDIDNDFVFNPSKDFFNQYNQLLEKWIESQNISSLKNWEPHEWKKIYDQL